jgi:hypothetical protein
MTQNRANSGSLWLVRGKRQVGARRSDEAKARADLPEERSIRPPRGASDTDSAVDILRIHVRRVIDIACGLLRGK